MVTNNFAIMAKKRDRGSVVERGNGWRVRVSVGIDPVTGKRLWLCGACGSKQEAERLRTKFLRQVDEKKGSRTRVTADPELRYIPSGVAVANFTVASKPRVFNKPTGEWRDGDPLFMRCQLWREPAEHVAECLTRGTRLIVYGRLQERSFETREGEKRTVIELLVDEIGPSLKWATAKVNRATRSKDESGPTTDDSDEPPSSRFLRRSGLPHAVPTRREGAQPRCSQ
jgi:single-strand DNA-binding protein